MDLEDVNVPTAKMAESHAVQSHHRQQPHNSKDHPNQDKLHYAPLGEPFPQKMTQQKNKDKESPYHSYNQFNPGQFKEGSPGWQKALLQYFLDMKKSGQKINEVTITKVRTVMYYHELFEE